MARRKRNKNNLNQIILAIIGIIFLIILAYIQNPTINNNMENTNTSSNINYSNQNVINTTINYTNILDIPEYSDQIYVTINNNIPYFTEEEHTTEAFEKYSELDENGRCGIAYANICKEIMPKEGEERGDIGTVKPTGWKQKKYDGEYLYNRCHLIGYQLSAENANKLNLITGTRYFNVSGMLPFENIVADYINKNKENVHVLYRVTPIFKEDNLLASGVEIEAYSVEDKGEGVCFNVYVHNVEPGITIDYKTGDSWKK